MVESPSARAGTGVRRSVTGVLVVAGALGYGAWEAHQHPHASPWLKTGAIAFGALVGLVVARLFARIGRGSPKPGHG
jgi:hypothetical protein